jgi:hypothetical protein
MRYLVLALAVFMAVYAYKALRAEPNANNSVRLGFWLTVVAWTLTNVPLLGMLAGALFLVSLASWVARGASPETSREAAPRSRQRGRRRDGGLDEVLATLPEAAELAELPEEEVYPYLDRSEVTLRLAAAERLRTVASEENADRLLEFLGGEQQEADSSVRLKLALALARLRRREALPVLVDALHPDRAGRWDALRAIVGLEARQYVPEILTLAARESRAVATVQALHAVVRLGAGERLLSPRARPLLRRYMRGLPDLLPQDLEVAKTLAELLLESTDPSTKETGNRLRRLLEFTETSEARERDEVLGDALAPNREEEQ